MDEKRKTFECAWCMIAFPDEPEKYTYPIDEHGGYDAETGLPICRDCTDIGEPAETLNPKAEDNNEHI